METTGLSFTRYFVIMLLLQVITNAERFTVTGPQQPILVPLGEVVELSCQLSPPQSAEHMEIRWFRNHYTKPVYLYVDGKDVFGETISKYVQRTELLKEAIGEGKVTLRIFNASVDDDGQYRCFFKDGDFYEEAITEVKVTATSLEIQILLHPPNTKGILVECNSGGWFPQPQMEWRDNRGEIVPHTSISHSQDTDKLFNMKMSLLLNQRSFESVTCYLRNPVTGQEEKTTIVLSDKLFLWKSTWILILTIILMLLLIFIMVYSIQLHFRFQEPQGRGVRSSSQSSVHSRTCSQICPCTDQRKDVFCKLRSPVAMGLLIIISSICVNIALLIYLSHKYRVPPSDLHFQLDTMWLEDISVILCVLMAFITMIISFIYFKLRGDHHLPPYVMQTQVFLEI